MTFLSSSVVVVYDYLFKPKYAKAEMVNPPAINIIFFINVINIFYWFS